MLIAIKDKGTVYIAQNLSEYMIDTASSDLVLDENIPFWKIDHSSYCYCACRSPGQSTDILSQEPDLFRNCQNAKDILKNGIPYMRRLLSERQLIDKDGCWYNTLVLVMNGKIYCIDAFFVLIEIDDLIVNGRGNEFITGGLEWEADQPIEERIRRVVRSYNEFRDEHFFPVVLHNCKTGRKKIINDSES